ncbi:AAA family ATPase [Sciscionella sediminilitoris]|uniref:AAA family ATPase n=1 Tax=Sciscionella sediminilitoris TaxID=1445613 RepID=UPI0004DFCDD3|nr:AAA family ATPase [Sciscionella sp. SE31]
MTTRRLLITGASGSGTTTLGRELAGRAQVPHADVDDYFWIPTDPPYVRKRAETERIELMRAVFLPRASWVLSGSLMGWGDSLMPVFDAAVFLTLDPEIRMRRLTERETLRYGGADTAASREFLDWARGYDDPGFSGRNLARHEQWLARLSCPVLRLDSRATVTELAESVTRWLEPAAVR